MDAVRIYQKKKKKNLTKQGNERKRRRRRQGRYWLDFFFFVFFFVSLPAREKGRMTVEVLGLQSRLELNLPVCLCERAHDVYCSAGRAAVVYSWPRSRLVR